jgi:hypothetical protein
MQQELKRWVNDALAVFGYRMVKLRPLKLVEGEEEGLESIFGFFTDWVGRFELQGDVYGGGDDYRSERISMLNVRKVLELVDFSDKSVIEFGPLEGGNTILLESLGAKSVVAIEGQPENFIKSCIIKNLYHLDRSTIILDDVRNATLEKYGRFDIAFVAGLLYHLDRPDTFLVQLSGMANQLVLSTFYADEESPTATAKVKEVRNHEKTYRGKLSIEGPGPCSGLERYSFWPFRDDLLAMITDAGYVNIDVIRDLTDANTKAKLVYLVAQKDPLGS